MSHLNESTVQKAAIEWLQELGYTYIRGNELKRDLKKVVVEDELRNFLHSKYPKLPTTAVDEAVARFTQQESMDLHYRNREFHLKLTQGITLSWKDKDGKECAEHVYPVNFESPEKNSFVCSDEVTIIGKNKRRTDLLIFINGLPLVFFEFKNFFDPEAGVDEAYKQLGHYVLDIPQLFEYNTFSVISDGREALHGMYSSGKQWFAPWKSIDGTTIVENDHLQLNILLFGLFSKEVLIDYLQNYIFHEDHNGKLIKKGAKYHQYFGVSEAVKRTIDRMKPEGDGRLGVIWHTQGSGKSISMAILTGILRTKKALKNPTIIIQVDRNDLDEQLYSNFVACKDLVGNVQHADSTDDLRDLLSSDGGGVIFTTIEKFRLKELDEGKERVHPVLSERYNIVVLADEAHRTQYGFNEGGYAQNLRRALPNASFLGFTGTPVDSKDADTELVFGPTIHTYDIKQAVEDGATVPILYEPKMIPLNIKVEYTEELESTTDDGSNNAVWAAIEDAAGAEDRVAKIAKDILDHYHKRSTSNNDGKAMIVCMSRRNCVKMYDALSVLDGCPEIAVIMTGNISKDPVAWNPHIRTKDSMEAVKERLRNPDDPLKMVIVRDMWLTGFDAPCLNTMYVDKIMKGHNLMQAIARVNRVFEDKPSGLIVDFIGISNFLADATKKYTGGGGKGKPTIDIEETVELCLQQLSVTKELMGGFEVETIRNLTASESMMWSREMMEKLLKDDPTTEAFLKEERKLSELVAMTSSDPRIWDIQEDVAIIQKFRKTIRIIKFPPGKGREKREAIKDLISKSLAANNIVDLAEMYDLENVDISIVDDQFQAIAKKKGSENVKIELLRRILNDEIRVRMSLNMAKMTTLKDELDKVLSKYHQNSLDSIATIKHLLDLANEFRNEEKRLKELGLTPDELAFYDLLSSKQHLINQEGPIQDLVHKVVASMKDQFELDWTKKGNAKAAVRLALKRELKGKVPFSELDNLLKEVIDQAEGQYGDWPLVG